MHCSQSKEILRATLTLILNLISQRHPLPSTHTSCKSLVLPALGTNRHPALTQPHSVCPAQIHPSLSSRGIAKPPFSLGIYHSSASNFLKIDLLALWGSKSSDGSLLSRGPVACHWTVAPILLRISCLTCSLGSDKP